MKRTAPVFLALLIFGALAAGCGQAAQPTSPPKAAPPSGAQTAAPTQAASPTQTTATKPAAVAPSGGGPSEIVAGLAVGLTGQYARESLFTRRGYELAVKEANDAGGVMVKDHGRNLPVRLIVYDDKSDNTTAVSLYEKLVTEDKVNVLFGGYSTPIVQAETVVAEKYRIPYVNGGGATGAIYERGMKYVFGTLASIEKLSFTLMDRFSAWQDEGKLAKPAKIALIGENSSHGTEFRQGVVKKADAAKDRFNIVVNEPFELNLKDADPLLQKVKTANADIFLADARLSDYTTIHRRYTELGLYHQIVSYGPRGPEKAARDALGPASDYIISANWWDPGIASASSQAFAKKYQAAYNETPEWFAALAYESARAMFKAIEAAGTLDKDKVRDALARVDLKDSLVPGGELKFKENGQADYDYLVIQNKPGGKNDIIYPKDAATGEAVVPKPRS